MKFIKKLWVRILLSLLLGGILAETIHVKTGSDALSNAIVPLVAAVSFSILSLIVWLDKFKYYFFPNWKSEESLDEDILDENLD